MDPRLPVDECLPQVLDAVREQLCVILRAPPGAGKTTRVPPALLAPGGLPAGKILLLQPRRIAARAAAHRLASQHGEAVGQTFGYQVRFDRKVTGKTRVIAMTTGILLRQLASDPLLDEVACVILDEFHERSLEVDLVLGMLHRIRSAFRPELAIVVMSATLDTEPVTRLMPEAVVIESAGRSYPVSIQYSKAVSTDRIEKQVAECLRQVTPSTDGDILVFLPGVGEIHRTADLVNASGFEIHKLFGDLSAQDQDRVLSSDSTRKIVLATNIAETSLTIPGITCVIDSGLARVMRFDPRKGLSSLRLQPISRASADQRAGRAGRTAAGTCYRLWPEAMHRMRPDHTLPEILTADLSAAVLMLASWGERDLLAFPWATLPTEAAISAATKLLRDLGAIDEQGIVTAEGERMNAMPVHPRLATLMLTAQRYDCVEEAALAAALLSERDPFPKDHRVPTAVSPELESDLYGRVVELQTSSRNHRSSRLDFAAAVSIRKVAQQLTRSLDSVSAVSSDSSDPIFQEPVSRRLGRAILAAYSDRLAKRREPGTSLGVMAGGRGVKLAAKSSVMQSELFVCLDVDSKGQEALVRMASAVDRSMLSKDSVRRLSEVFFDDDRRAVVARNRIYYRDLLIDETPTKCTPNANTATVLSEQALKAIDQVMPTDDRSLHSFLERLRFLNEHVLQGNPAAATENRIDEALPEMKSLISKVLGQLCQTRTSFDELTKAPWLDHLRGHFSYPQMQRVDKQAPESIRVPSGNSIRVRYESGKPPVLAVRIQEIFGWRQTPRIANGQVTIQLHLLGPNRRPQQVTNDLESFWATTYPVIRKELKRRYSKHHWPDDPRTAKATANGLKPRD